MPGGCRNLDLLATGHGCDATSTALSTQSQVYINGLLVVRKGDPVSPHTRPFGFWCVPHTSFVNQGSPNVYLNGIKVARIGDSADEGAMVRGSTNVFLNEAHLTRNTIRFDGVGKIGSDAGRQFTKLLNTVEKNEGKAYDGVCCSYGEIPTTPTRAEVEEVISYVWGCNFILMSDLPKHEDLTGINDLIKENLSDLAEDGFSPIGFWFNFPSPNSQWLYYETGTLDELKTKFIKEMVSLFILNKTNFKELLDKPQKFFFGGQSSPIFISSYTKAFDYFSGTFGKSYVTPGGSYNRRYDRFSIIMGNDPTFATKKLEEVGRNSKLPLTIEDGNWGVTPPSTGKWERIYMGHEGKIQRDIWTIEQADNVIHETTHKLFADADQYDIESIAGETLKRIHKLSSSKKVNGQYWFSGLQLYNLGWTESTDDIIGSWLDIFHSFENEFLARFSGQMMSGSCLHAKDVLKKVPGLITGADPILTEKQIEDLDDWFFKIHGLDKRVVRVEPKSGEELVDPNVTLAGCYTSLALDLTPDQEKKLNLTKRQILKIHIRKFYKNIAVVGDPIFDNYLKTFGYADAADLKVKKGSEIYPNRELFEKDFNDFVENSVNLLPDDANILDNPNFYLPITASQPPMLAGKYLLGVGGEIQPAAVAEFPGLAVDTMLVEFGEIHSPDKASDVLRTSIHEYSHTIWDVRDDSYKNYNVPYDADIPYKDRDPFNIRNKSYVVIPYEYGPFQGWDLPSNKYYVKNLQTLYKGDKGLYGPFSDMDGYASLSLISETVVRVRSAAGTRSNHSSLDDMFSPEDQKKLFQPKFIKLLNKLGWP
jgi:uncharacterized Zn-binding protein involved in type VI secretion